MKTHLSPQFTFAVLAACLISSTSQADIIASYDFEASSQTETVLQNNLGLSVSRDQHAETQAGFYQTRIGDFTPNDSGITPNVSAFQNHAFAFSTNTQEATSAAGNNFYHEFSVTIQDGEYNLDELTFDYWVNNTPNIGDFSVSVYAERTGYDLGSELLQYQYIKQTPADVEIQQVSLDNLGSIAEFQGLSSGDEIEFRLVFNDAFDGGFVHRVNDVQLTALTIAPVPEPGTVGILGLIVCGFAARRRR